MSHLSLYRKYRPQTFAEILGQDHVSTTLTHAITEDRVAHAYLFTGPRGTGKTSTARILAKALNCAQGPTPSPCGVCASCVAITEGSSMDVIEMDAASHSKVEETREILAGVPLAASSGQRKVYVIDEVHMLSTSAFNALLKTLEEPPSHVVFVLATTEPHKVLPTIISRTQRFDFRRVSADVLEGHLGAISKLEQIDIEPDALALIARHADGGVRDALSVLDQLSNWGERISVEDVSSLLGGRRDEDLLGLFDAISSGDVAGVFQSVATAVGEGADVRQMAISVLDHTRNLLFLKAVPGAENSLDVGEGDIPRFLQQSGAFTNASLLRILELVTKALAEMRNVANHRLLLEVALIRSTDPDTDSSVEALLGRIERLERRAGISAGETSAGDTVTPATVATSPPPSKAPPRATPSPAPRAPKAAPKATVTASPVEASPPSEDIPSTVEVPPIPASGIGLGHIKDAWTATLQEVSKRGKRVAAYLNPSTPVRLEDDRLVVEVQSEFHTTAMAEQKSMSMLQDAIHAALGVRLRLQFVARGAEPAPEPDSEADLEGAVPIEDHDPVELIKKGFSAEVVEKGSSS
ncbi:MAG TPA: DNA polymerase III subunit gamma/tau [Actinomycetota bacterium]|nr:DNA polymerase III subunit gamma/tau [Actinomycetota bacterium]